MYQSEQASLCFYNKAAPNFSNLLTTKVYFMLMLHVPHGLTGKLLLIEATQGLGLRISHHLKHCWSSCQGTQGALEVLALASKISAQKGHTLLLLSSHWPEIVIGPYPTTWGQEKQLYLSTQNEGELKIFGEFH